MKSNRKLIALTTFIAMVIALTGFAMSTGDIINSIDDEPVSKEISYVEPKYAEHEVPEPAEEKQIDAMDESEPEVEPDFIEYTIKAGDSLWNISKEYYGDGTMYTAILAYNDMSYNDVIHPGDIIKIANSEIAAEVYNSIPVVYEEESNQDVVETTPTPVSNTSYGLSSFDGNISVEEAVTIIKDQPVLDTTGMTYMGNWKITGYDPHCDHCCGKHDGITASGNQAEFGVSVGCNNLPLGTQIYIEGYGVFRVDDRGGNSKNHIDIASPSHDACYQMTGRANVYVISYP